MPGIRRRFGSARKIRGSRGVPRGSIGGRLNLQGFSVGSLSHGGGIHTPRINIKFPRIGTPRVHAGGISIVPRVSFVSFDRSIIKTNWNAINRTPLQQAANLVRMTARQSIRYRKTRSLHSPVGSPPFSHRKGVSPPFKQIYNVPAKLGTSQIIGMVGYGSSPPVPGLHEHGGRADRSVYNKSRLGMKQARTSLGRFQPLSAPKFIQQSVRYPQRPFMRPALAKASPRISKFWTGAFARHAMIGRGARILPKR